MPWLNIAAAAIGGLLSYKAAKEQRKQAIADQDNQYVRMRNAAQRAGFNPLTVLRATGGQGFTGLPVISKAAAFGNAAAGIFDAVRQEPIDKYNEEIRDLDKEQREVTLSIDKLKLENMKKPIVKKQLEGADIKVTNAKDIKVTTNGPITAQPLVPGTGMTLDEIFEQQPVDNRVIKTGDGSYTNDIMSAALYPLVTPGGNVIYVPWNPEDADIGAIAGGTLQYGGLKAYDKIQNFNVDRMLNKIDQMSEKELNLRIQLERMN